MYCLISIGFFLIYIIILYGFERKIQLDRILYCLGGLVVLSAIVIGGDFAKQTSDTEIWSGKIVGVEHKEEWEEWIPPTTDDKGNITSGGYYEHHNAENYIKTSDNGRVHIKRTKDGKRFTDHFVNTTNELENYYPIGSPTASTHGYTNKLKASYSIFKNKEIDLNNFKDMPEYPTKVNNDLYIDRAIGKFKNKALVNKHLANINANLNDTDNPNNKQKVKGYKQVNLMFVNFGNKTEEYGYALQDYWKNGAKNDFIITFGTDSKGNITWCHPFSWTEVEILKSDVREYMIGKNTNNFNKSITDISKLIEEKFDRKEFADFNYIQVDTSVFGKVLLTTIFIIACVIYKKWD